jgi:cupin 2 domain-containing protein
MIASAQVIANIFSNIPEDLPEELFETLAKSGSIRLERIVSHGHATADDQWYDQDCDEWVLLLTGSAGLLFEGQTDPQVLEAGDYVMIPAHCRHRVAWTDQRVKSVWLAVHFSGGAVQ